MHKGYSTAINGGIKLGYKLHFRGAGHEVQRRRLKGTERVRRLSEGYRVECVERDIQGKGVNLHFDYGNFDL